MAKGQADPNGGIGRVLGCGAAVLIVFVALIGGAAVVFSRLDIEWFDIEVGPGEGKDSARLAVAVSPRTGLADGSVVTVTSEAFEADTVVGVAVCLEAADTDRLGVEACDTVSGARYATDSEGRLRATFAVPRVITVDGTARDCAAPATACVLVAASASDFDLSGGQAIGFRTDLPRPDLTPEAVRPGSDLLPVVGRPAGPIAPGTSVEVSAMGFQPGEPLIAAWCSGFPAAAAQDSCEPVDPATAYPAVMFHRTAGITLHARADGTVVLHVEAKAAVDPPMGEVAGCTTEPGRCALVISAAADTKRSAVLPYTLKIS